MWSPGDVSHEDFMNLCWTTWSHCFGIMPSLMKLWRFDGIHVWQALNACPPHGSITRKECLMFVIHIVDLVALVWCIWSLLCSLICWNIFQQVKMCLLICWMVFQLVKRLVVVVLNCDLFNQLIYFLIGWFHLSQVKSTGWFGNQPVEFRNSLTISVVIFEREVTRPFFSAKLF